MDGTGSTVQCSVCLSELSAPLLEHCLTALSLSLETRQEVTTAARRTGPLSVWRTGWEWTATS